jgi:hypothetical protein
LAPASAGVYFSKEADMPKQEDKPYVYKPYPRSLYLGGDVLAERIVVEGEVDEVEARQRGYLKAHEKPMESLVATDAVMDMLRAQEEAPAPAAEPPKAVPNPAHAPAKPKKK